MFGIDDAITAVSNLAKDVVDRIWPDATIVEKAKIEQVAKQMEIEYSSILAQLKINEVEAGSPHWFVAAARPAAMWVGVISLLYSGVGVALLNWGAVVFGLPMFPIIDPAAATNILMGLLGLGAARTVEKVQGVATKKIGK
jgi:hypothetical protein